MAEAVLDAKSGLAERQLVTFHLGKEEFGADIMHIREIIRLTEVTKVPHAPSYVEGVCNLRGSILPIIDGRARFGMEPKQHWDENTRVLVIDIKGRVTGIIVDRVSEVMRVTAADIEKPPQVIQNIDAAYLDGVVKLNGGKRLIMALNLSHVLTMDAVDIDGRETPAGLAAADLKAERSDLSEDQLVTFLLDQEEYAFDIMQVKEIIRVPDITVVPNVANYIEGVVSIRSRLLPIVNLRVFFNLPDMEATDQARIIIVDLGVVTAGFRVDRVQEVIRVPQNIIEPPSAIFDAADARQIKGVAKLNQGARLLMCLNAQNLLPLELVQQLTEGGTNNEYVETGTRTTMDEIQLVTFRLANEEFAIHIAHVQEINRMTEITRMPNAPAFIDGLVNLRGNIIPVLNLRRRFGLAERGRDDATRIIIVDAGSQKTGIVVDAVSEVLRFDKSLVEETPGIMSSSGVDADYINGVAKLNDGRRMVMILDLPKVVSFTGKIRGRAVKKQ